MCRNIKPLFNYDPPVTEEEIAASARQYVRKVSGFTNPSQVNAAVFETAVAEVSEATKRLLNNLVTKAPPRDRELESVKAKARAAKRYER